MLTNQERKSCQTHSEWAGNMRCRRNRPDNLQNRGGGGDCVKHSKGVRGLRIEEHTAKEDSYFNVAQDILIV